MALIISPYPPTTPLLTQKTRNRSCDCRSEWRPYPALQGYTGRPSNIDFLHSSFTCCWAAAKNSPPRLTDSTRPLICRHQQHAKSTVTDRTRWMSVLEARVEAGGWRAAERSSSRPCHQERFIFRICCLTGTWRWSKEFLSWSSLGIYYLNFLHDHHLFYRGIFFKMIVIGRLWVNPRKRFKLNCKLLTGWQKKNCR